MLSEWRYADSEGACGSYHPEVGLIRGPRQREGSMQGGKNQHLRTGYRQTVCLRGSILGWAALRREVLLGGSGLVAAFRPCLWAGGSAYPQVMPTWLPDFTIWGHLKHN